jgi:hypothetical protein
MVPNMCQFGRYRTNGTKNHTKCTKNCGLRTNCNAVLKELGRKNLNWIVARSSHISACQKGNRGTNFARHARALRNVPTATAVVSERHHGRLLTCSPVSEISLRVRAAMQLLFSHNLGALSRNSITASARPAVK